jgi:hypothetical protein
MLASSFHSRRLLFSSYSFSSSPSSPASRTRRDCIVSSITNFGRTITLLCCAVLSTPRSCWSPVRAPDSPDCSTFIASRNAVGASGISHWSSFSLLRIGCVYSLLLAILSFPSEREEEISRSSSAAYLQPPRTILSLYQHVILHWGLHESTHH